MSLKKFHPDVRFGKYRAAPDEVDWEQQYCVIDPSTSATWIGTAAGGTATVAKDLVLINAQTDYPRNLLYSAVGTNDFGGTWQVVGKDQFGKTQSETVVSGTVAAGTPAFAIAGTAIFSSVTAGTFTATSTSVGIGSARLGLAIGTAATAKAWFGLPAKIKAVSDVKSIRWSKESVQTTMNGGTIDSTLVGTATNAFAGTAIMGGTEKFIVGFKSTYPYEENVYQR